jgi:hypothetical protein
VRSAAPLILFILLLSNIVGVRCIIIHLPISAYDLIAWTWLLFFFRLWFIVLGAQDSRLSIKFRNIIKYLLTCPMARKWSPAPFVCYELLLSMDLI